MIPPPKYGSFLTKRQGYRPKNWNFDQAKQQLLQLSRAAAEDWRNSVFVEGYTVKYWSATKYGGITCTCRANSIDLTSDEQEPVDTVTALRGQSNDQRDGLLRFKVTDSDDVFGGSPNDSVHETPQIDEFGLSEEADASGLRDWIANDFEDSADCAICYRLGRQPGYQRVNAHRLVLTSLNISASSSSFVDQAEKPHMINVEEEGWVSYSFTVPRYWSTASVQVYKNHDVYEQGTGVFVDPDLQTQVSHAWLDARRGQPVVLYVSADQYTHAVVDFELPANPIRISLPQLQKMRDYTRFISIPLTRIIVDNVVPLCQVHDILFCEQLNLTWKVTEVNPLTITDGYQVGWEIQARLVQPTEGTGSLIVDHQLPTAQVTPPPPAGPVALLGTFDNYAYQGLTYISSIAVIEGVGPFSISDQLSPAGLAAVLVGRALRLQGIPTTLGLFDTGFVTVKDMTTGLQATVSYSVTVYAPIQITNVLTSSMVVGVLYDETFQSTGGALPSANTWSVAGTTPLPPGITLNPATGQVTGVPTTLGTYPVTFRVTDVNGQYSELALVFDVAAVAPPSPSSPGDLHFTYEQTTPATVWTITHGLKKYPSVTTVDQDNVTIVGQVEYLTLNTVRVTFSVPYAGSAYLN